MKSDVTVNERIKDLRTERGLNQVELAEATGIPASTISDYEQDGVNIPHTAVIVLADYFDVSLDYLLCRTNIRHNEEADAADALLSEGAVAVLKRKEVNSRLVSEIIESEGFIQMMIDAEGYVDGFLDQMLGYYDLIYDRFQEGLEEQHDFIKDSHANTMERLHVSQAEYFANIFTKELTTILEGIKEAHAKDRETADPLFTAEQLKEIMDAGMSQKNQLSRGIAVISTALRLKLNEKNRQSAESFLISGGENEEALSNLLSQSELTEPDARKRRRKKK